MVEYWRRRVVMTEPGPGTMPGPGDHIIDNFGERYRLVSDAEARMIEAGTTGGWVRRVRPDGTID